MDDAARTEYPAMLASMQPGQAARTLSDRVKRINKVNLDIADWLQERRRVEEQYVLGLRRLAQSSKGPNSPSDLGVFQPSWSRITSAVESIAQSHHIFAEKLEEDLEQPLRSCQQRQDYVNMHEMSSNFSALSRKMEKPGKKDNRIANQQEWDSTAPYIFEKLQEVDESRVNHLRDILTQYQTHEADQAERVRGIAAQTLAIVVEVKTEDEIRDFASSTVAGLSPPPTRSSARRSSIAGRTPSFDQPSSHVAGGMGTLSTTISNPPAGRGPASQQSRYEDDVHEQLHGEPPKESKLRRLGTLLGRRRQGSRGGFGSLSPSKSAGASSFGRLGSSHGRGPSPHTSSINLHDSGRLASLAETTDAPTPSHDDFGNEQGRFHVASNGVNQERPNASGGMNGSHSADLLGVSSLMTSSDTHHNEDISNLAKDSEGFTVRRPMNDPISEAQREAAAEESDQVFKLSIQNKPLTEEDPEAKQAALSNVANTLKMGPATRRTSTIRGRREARNNTAQVPAVGANAAAAQNMVASPQISPSPTLAGSSSFTRSSALNVLASETSVAGTSDSQSVRSGHSLGSLIHAKHPDLTGPGLQSSIIETVSAMFEDGVMKSASISGELAFINNDPEASFEKTHETIRINNAQKLERIGPNRIFVHNASSDQPDQFALDLSYLSKTSIAFSYRVVAQESDPSSLSQHAPIVLHPVWKPQDDKLGLLLQYHLNPASAFAAPVTLQGVVLVAAYEGKATAAQTKPSGTHLKDKHLVYWRLGDVTLTSDVQKIVCRTVGADGVCPRPSHIEARWEYMASGEEVPGSGISVSILSDKAKGKELSDDDPFADAGSPGSLGQTWVDVPVVRRLVSGRYEAK